MLQTCKIFELLRLEFLTLKHFLQFVLVKFKNLNYTIKHLMKMYKSQNSLFTFHFEFSFFKLASSNWPL